MDIKLTEYSHGAGCGCKISPEVLENILKTELEVFEDKNLIVGNSTKDDAAVYSIGDGRSIVSTTDFFMPIVDDAFTFGKIAATNSLSDVYAMGGKPIMAISILGWPVDKLSTDIAKKVLDGARTVCNEANITLAGGHSIDSPEPIFGLAVTGILENKNLKRNNMGKKDCEIFITKALGVGIITSAQKKKKIENNDIDEAINSMCKLNKIGYEFSKLDSVLALTDVTGFGLLGHLLEICESSNISANIYKDKIPLLKNTKKYIKLDCIPGGSKKNFKSYSHKVSDMDEETRHILCDPQTSGGLLAIVEKNNTEEFLNICEKNGLNLSSIGETTRKKEKFIYVL